MAARFGGDEFALLLTGLDRPDHADEVADRLRRSLLPPGTFIPLAERTGHIVALGNHVLASACRRPS
jgi:predicted signal transduction protein with EAL and GGDEF domain